MLGIVTQCEIVIMGRVQCEIVIMGRVQVLLLFSVFFLASGERRERKKEGLKWFPASKEEDCGEVPDPVQVSCSIE